MSIAMTIIMHAATEFEYAHDDLNEWIKEMRGLNIIIGDFNFPDIQWEEGRSGSRGRDFHDATMDAFIEQHVVEPTHASGSLIDLILCNKEGMVKEVRAEDRVGKSDHDMISFVMDVANKKREDQ